MLKYVTFETACNSYSNAFLEIKRNLELKFIHTEP